MKTFSTLTILCLLIVFNSALAKECYNDYECGMGNKCVKAQGNIGFTGTCVTPVDRFGQPKNQYSFPRNSKPEEVKACRFDTQCGIGFTCAMRDGQLNGICVKD